MTLIKSISGIRGTIGGQKGDNLSPEDILLYTASYAEWLKETHKFIRVKSFKGFQKNNSTADRFKVVIGRDARISGELVANLVASSLMSLGIDVVDLGLSTTPTVELAVTMENADGGIIITASHNTKEWNALKLLNDKGEFLSADDGKRIIEIADGTNFEYAQVQELGSRVYDNSYLNKHIQHVLGIDEVNKEAISKRKLKVVVDAVNSTGGLFVPELLRKLGVEDIVEIYCEPTGLFPHNPEPLAENLIELSKKVVETESDLGIAVDPDVDRLVFVREDGELFGEEYTLVAVADYILSKSPGNTVSNLSSTRALRDVTEIHGGRYYASSVGEVNVVEKMKQNKALIGGEGNGGVIFPKSHYGRDALVGIALFLSHLCTWKDGAQLMSDLKKSYPIYFMSKNKIQLDQGMDVNGMFNRLSEVYSSETINTDDGLKIDFKEEWVHLRKSNTEPIIRIYSEAKSQERADEIATGMVDKIKSLI